MNTRSRHFLRIRLVANVFEGYEFSIFAFLIGFIARLFSASSVTLVGFIKGLLLVAMTYLMRLLGGLFFERMGDHLGNAQVLRVSLLLMSIPTALIGFFPTYAQGGAIVTVLLLSLRLVQGFAMADELPISTPYVFENAVPRYRSLFFISTTIGGLLGWSTIWLWLNVYFDQAAILAWAWRIPFILSIPLGTVGFYTALILDTYVRDKKLKRH
jgi:MFS transporter, MHS family, proline/betaine transporter